MFPFCFLERKLLLLAKSIQRARAPRYNRRQCGAILERKARRVRWRAQSVCKWTSNNVNDVDTTTKKQIAFLNYF